jgi:hypothetical protein
MYRIAVAAVKASGRDLLNVLIAAFFVLPLPASAQQPVPQPAEKAAVTPAARAFSGETGLVLNFVKSDKTADFEAVIEKLKEALQASADPVRQQQAAGWRVYKSSDPAAGGAALYVFIVDPAVKGADYSVSSILAEAFASTELSALYKQYNEAYTSTPALNFVSLSLVADLGR